MEQDLDQQEQLLDQLLGLLRDLLSSLVEVDLFKVLVLQPSKRLLHRVVLLSMSMLVRTLSIMPY